MSHMYQQYLIPGMALQSVTFDVIVPNEPLAFGAGFVAGIVTLVATYIYLYRRAYSTDNVRPSLDAVFVDPTTGEALHTVAEAMSHARDNQGWVPDGPNDDSWRVGFVVRPVADEVEA